MLRLVPGSDRSNRKMTVPRLSEFDLKEWFDRLVHIEVEGRHASHSQFPVDLAIDAVYFAILKELLHNWLEAKYDLSRERPAKEANGRPAKPFNRLLHIADQYGGLLARWEDRMRHDEVGGLDVDRYDLMIDGLHRVDQRSLIQLAFAKVIQYEYTMISIRSFRRLVRAEAKMRGITSVSVYAALRERLTPTTYQFHPCFSEPESPR